MSQDPDVIRQQIRETRAEMGDTADALGYKADVKGRAKDNVQGKVDAVTGSVAAAKEKLVGGASHAAAATPTGSDLRDGAGARLEAAKDTIGDGAAAAKQAASVAQQNPIGLAVGAIAVGFLGGLLIPTTRIEEEKVGPVADDLREHVVEAGQEAFERGKGAAAEAAQTVREAAQAAGEAARDSVQEAAPAAAR